MPSVTRKAKTGRTRREAAETNVFDAVERLLSDGASYTELGVQQIAEEAGIGRSTFYVHFADKTDLLIRLTRATTAELFGASEDWLREGHDAGYPALENTIREVCSQRRSHHAAMNALSEVAAYDAVVGEFWRMQIDTFADRFATMLAADKKRGLTDPELDAKGTAIFLTWGVERTLEQQMVMGKARDDEKIVVAASRAMWLAMYGRAGD